jgi:hypothetical protein
VTTRFRHVLAVAFFMFVLSSLSFFFCVVPTLLRVHMSLFSSFVTFSGWHRLLTPSTSGIKYPPNFTHRVIIHGCTRSGCVLNHPHNLVWFVVLYQCPPPLPTQHRLPHRALRCRCCLRRTPQSLLSLRQVPLREDLRSGGHIMQNCVFRKSPTIPLRGPKQQS